MRSRNSITSTSLPNRFHTLPSSTPMYPPPITIIRFGTSVIESVGRAEDVLPVKFDPRQLDRRRSGRDEDALRLVRLRLVLHIPDFNSPRRSDSSVAFEMLDLVLAEQHSHPAGELLDDFVLALHHLRQVEGEFPTVIPCRAN